MAERFSFVKEALPLRPGTPPKRSKLRAYANAVARSRLKQYGLDPGTHPVLLALVQYLCQRPCQPKATRAATQRVGNHLRWLWTELPRYRDSGATDADLVAASRRVLSGRWSYVQPYLAWDEWWEYRPKYDWHAEFRYAGLLLVRHVIEEARWK